MPELRALTLTRSTGGAEPLPVPPAWMSEGSCTGDDVDPELFFSPDGERGLARSRREQSALTVCARCPVRSACLDYARGTGQTDGVWGGRT